jgi:hypothetical protein
MPTQLELTDSEEMMWLAIKDQKDGTDDRADAAVRKMRRVMGSISPSEHKVWWAGYQSSLPEQFGKEEQIRAVQAGNLAVVNYRNKEREKLDRILGR